MQSGKPHALSRTQDPFTDAVSLINAARVRASRAVTSTLVELYWELGGCIARRVAAGAHGDGVVIGMSEAIQRAFPGQRGFTRANLFRMKRFRDAYADNAKVAALLRLLPWSLHLLILERCKSIEEREFYVRQAADGQWTYRRLLRELRANRWLEATTARPMHSPALVEEYPEASTLFRDAYLLDFLQLPPQHQERDLHAALLSNLQRFIQELGPEFCFVGSQFPLQVGNRDFALDLLFFHRGLSALVAVELKADRFEPEHLGKLEFYLEALDAQVRKPHERPSIGLLLCSHRDTMVAEYALRRALSPALIAEYRTALPPTDVIAARLEDVRASILPMLRPEGT